MRAVMIMAASSQGDQSGLEGNRTQRRLGRVSRQALGQQERKALAKALAAFEIGNVPLVTRLDRLTRPVTYGCLPITR